MESKEKRTLFLSKLFQHLDGIVLIPVILALQKYKILNHIHVNKKCGLKELTKKYNANEGYLNVALRLLCSQGLIIQEIYEEDVFFSDKNLKKWLSLDIVSKYQITMPLYQKNINYNEIINHNEDYNIDSSILFQTIQTYTEQKTTQQINHSINLSTNNNLCLHWETHIEGAIIGPIIVLLTQSHCIQNIEAGQKITITTHNKWKQLIIKLFFCVNMIDNQSKVTEYGCFILKRATSYGVTVSYLPTFRKMNTLLYGDCENIWKTDKAEEIHVDRSMNVWGSGGAHHTYFKKVDKIIIDLFNRPLDKQPKGFIDIGCGNGKLIEHIFDLIYYKTKRGKNLTSHPLFIVGSDFNYKALDATKDTISKADIWAKTAFGDISDPDGLSERLKKEHQINLSDLLNVRSFLDHNRIYSKPIQQHPFKSLSTGAFCHKGKRLTNKEVEQNLKEHFEKWAPYLKKYGLLIVELHTIDPLLAANNIGKTAITAYDASHGLSDQYIIEYNLFLKTASAANLKPDPEHEYTFPSKEIPIVSINRLV